MCLLARTSSIKPAFLFLSFPGFREEPFIGASAFAGAFSFLEERMSEQPKRYEQALVDALVAGDPAGLGTALRWLSKTDAGRFLAVTKQLLDTKREKKLSAVLLRRQFRLRSGLCRL